MAQESSLPAPLVVKDLQSGFAGETGTVWTVAPDRSYTVARQIGLKVLEPHAHGQVTPEQWTRLQELGNRLAILPPPEQQGEEPQVNARQITLSYGGKQTMLAVPPGRPDRGAPRSATEDDATRTMLELVDDLKAMTGG